MCARRRFLIRWAIKQLELLNNGHGILFIPSVAVTASELQANGYINTHPSTPVRLFWAILMNDRAKQTTLFTYRFSRFLFLFGVFLYAHYLQNMCVVCV
ncbi:hypothetical protein BCR43DRAFT_77712 [Syncephalastrum racemosum]|uniref:Uncharacterized protein n=1 Tax=Syncephalastrum racemosum TaxID=13706 RepID=A0A1X2H2I3_SYNRA|nr:hypothetical protein BCR43DRAFT_77712 [Syncephalastrum racemosum]